MSMIVDGQKLAVYGALVCRDVAFGGRCAAIDRNVRDLGFRANDTISSIRVG